LELQRVTIMGLPELLKHARTKIADLTQEVAAQRTGLDDSAISAFETGRREPRLGQLEKLAEVYHLPLSYFFGQTPPPSQAVLWRNKPENDTDIRGRFLELCRQYRNLEIWTGKMCSKQLPALDLGEGRFHYPQVEKLAHDARHALQLGSYPSESLLRVLEEVHGVKVFHLDIGPDSSAACARSEEFGEAILLNTNPSVKRWRRNFDLAHELFHLLTWKRFRHEDVLTEPSVQEEKYATCFASNLLLPTDEVSSAIVEVADEQGRVSLSLLDDIARRFDVSLEALLWKMHFLYNWPVEQTKKLIGQAKAYVATAPREDSSKPPELPERFRALAIHALQEGEVSLASFAKLMKLNRIEAEQYLSEGEIPYAEISSSVA